jgi:hypothetical protein
VLDELPRVGRHGHRDHSDHLLGGRVDLVDEGGAGVRDPDRPGRGDHAPVDQQTGDRHGATFVDVCRVDPAELRNPVVEGGRPDLVVQVRRPQAAQVNRVSHLGGVPVDPD